MVVGMAHVVATQHALTGDLTASRHTLTALWSYEAAHMTARRSHVKDEPGMSKSNRAKAGIPGAFPGHRTCRQTKRKDPASAREAGSKVVVRGDLEPWEGLTIGACAWGQR